MPKLSLSSYQEPDADEKPVGLGHRSLVEVVTEAVVREIQTGAIKPGERIMPAMLAKRLDVSQTPVREAMRTLEMQGLIVVDRRNTFASPLSVDGIRDIYNLRRIIECNAARNAVRNQTPEDVRRAERALAELQRHANDPYSDGFWRSHHSFHWSIYRASSKSDWTRRVLELLWREVERYVRISINTYGSFETEQHFDAVSAEHEAMLESFKRKDADRLVAIIDQHLSRTAESLEESVAEMNRLNK